MRVCVCMEVETKSNPMDDAFQVLIEDLHTCTAIEAFMSGKHDASTKQANGKRKREKTPSNVHLEKAMPAVKKSVQQCEEARSLHTSQRVTDCSDAALSALARFTDDMALKPFQPFLQYVPRLVNVVTLAEAFPIPGSNIKLPLDLGFIASRCTGAYFAPKRFSAVQLAYTNPRARVLIFRM